MEPFTRFDSTALMATLCTLGAAFVLGGLIGLERQFRQRSAGLRTMVLVSVGAAAFVYLGGRIFGPEGQDAGDGLCGLRHRLSGRPPI